MTNTLIIPALHPDERLLELVEEMRAISPDMQIVIVDDGSGPAYGQIFDRLKFMHDCIICQHPENYGKGAAIKTGIGHMKRHYPGCTGYITADADGQHRPVDILKVAKALQHHPDQLILGMRDFDQEQVPFKSRWGNRITSGVFRLITGRTCPDTQTGLRGIPAKYAELALDVPGERFEYEMNFLMAATQDRIHFMEVPIGTVYLERNRSSHFRPVRDSARIYGTILKNIRPRNKQCGQYEKKEPSIPGEAGSPQRKEKAVIQEAPYADHAPAIQTQHS